MKTYRFTTPLTSEIENLRIGDVVYITGTMVTARDQVHKRVVVENRRPPIDMQGLVLFHAGPIVRREDKEYKITSIGPTTSMRMEPYEDVFIAKTGVKMIVGKGFMGERTAKACRKYGVVVTMFPGGCGALGARAVKRVINVYWIELGVPEALWVLEVKDFGPLIVTIDSKGRNMLSEYKYRFLKTRKIIDELIRGINAILQGI